MYNSYAETKGFNPVNVPDPGKKIREQGLEALRGMEEELNWNTRQTDRIVNALEKNAVQEKQNADLNNQLRRGYADKLAGAKWKQFETLINNEGVKARQRQKDWQALLNLTQSGAQLAKAWNDKREKDADAYARDLKEQHGIGWKEYEAIRSFDRSIFEHQTSLEAALQEIGLEGVPLEVINRIRNSGSYKGLRVAELSAISLARSLPQIYEDLEDKEYDLGGDGEGIKVSLLTANSEQIPEILRLIRREKRDEFKNWPSSNIWESSGAWKIAEQADSVYIKDRTRAEAKSAATKYDKDEAEIIVHQIERLDDRGFKTGALGIHNAITHLAGGPDAPGWKFAQAKKRVVKGTIYALKNGLLTIEQVQELEDLPVKVRGVKGEVKWGHHFKTEWAQIEDAMYDAAVEEGKRASIGDKLINAADLEFKEEVRGIYSSEDVNMEEAMKMLNAAKKQGYTKTAAYITARMAQGQQAHNDAEGTAVLLARAARNEIITEEEINQWNFSEETKALVVAEVRKNNHLLPQEGEDGTLERLKERITEELNIIIPKNVLGSGNATRKDAELYALSKASGYYKEHRLQENGHEASYLYARDLITRDIKAKDGEYRPGAINKDGTREFFKWQANTDRTQVSINKDKLLKEIAADPGIIFTKQYIPTESIRTLSAKTNRGLYPEISETAMMIQSITRGKISAIDFLVAQTQRAIDQEIKETGSSTIQPLPKEYTQRFAEELQKVSPNVQRLLNTIQMADVNRAATSPKEDGTMGNIPYQKPVYDKLRVIAKKPYNNDYNSIGPGVNSIDALDVRITGATLRQVLQLFENNTLTSAGAYGFSAEQLKSAAEAGGIPYTTRFNKENQDKLFEILYRSKQYQPLEVSSEEDQMILDDTQNMEDESSDPQLGFYRASWLRPEALAYLIREGHYATA